MKFDRQTDDDKLDEALEQTFPASDSPGNTVATGIRLGVQPLATTELVVRDNREASRFEVVIGGQVAFLRYDRRPDAFIVVHTEVPESLRGKGIGALLATVGLKFARAQGLPIVVRCPFVRAYLRTHPEVVDPTVPRREPGETTPLDSKFAPDDGPHTPD